MFTGIVERLGRCEAVQHLAGGGARLRIAALPWRGDDPAAYIASLQPGDSIAVNGACVTVTERSGHAFYSDLMPETLRATNLGSLEAGEPVNLERPLRLGDRLGGHLVLGHVAGLGRLMAREPLGNAEIFRIEAPDGILRYCIDKGSVAVDGVSLTLLDVTEQGFAVSVIPHTLERTNLGSRSVGARLNLEPDIVGRYLEHFFRRASRRGGSAQRKGQRDGP